MRVDTEMEQSCTSTSTNTNTRLNKLTTQKLIPRKIGEWATNFVTSSNTDSLSHSNNSSYMLFPLTKNKRWEKERVLN